MRSDREIRERDGVRYKLGASAKDVGVGDAILIGGALEVIASVKAPTSSSGEYEFDTTQGNTYALSDVSSFLKRVKD